ncbi:PREDICTED: arabinogalactan peptide 20-like [Fragaria vesca subsp. vesca]
MAVNAASFNRVVAIFALIFAIVLPMSNAAGLSPAPAPTSDGTAIDQGIAYILMLLALVLTYLIH